MTLEIELTSTCFQHKDQFCSGWSTRRLHLFPSSHWTELNTWMQSDFQEERSLPITLLCELCSGSLWNTSLQVVVIINIPVANWYVPLITCPAGTVDKNSHLPGMKLYLGMSGMKKNPHAGSKSAVMLAQFSSKSWFFSLHRGLTLIYVFF